MVHKVIFFAQLPEIDDPVLGHLVLALAGAIGRVGRTDVTRM